MKGRKLVYEHSFASVVIYMPELNMSSSSSESEQSSDSVRQGLLADSGDEDCISCKFSCESV